MLLARDFAEMNDALSQGVYAEHRLISSAAAVAQGLLLVVELGERLVVVLSPGENVIPVADVVADEGETGAPRLYDRLYLLEDGAVVGGVVGAGAVLVQLRQCGQVVLDLEGLLELDYLLGGL